MKTVIALFAALPLVVAAQSAPAPEKKDPAPEAGKPALNLRLDSRELRSTIRPSTQETYKKQDDAGLPGLSGSSATSKILEQQPSPEKIVPISNDRL